MSVTLAKSAGYCFGVRRAVQLAMDHASPARPIYADGALIHNRHAIQELRQHGVITAEQPEQIPAGAQVLIRAHGVPPRELQALQEKGCRILDATCP